MVDILNEDFQIPNYAVEIQDLLEEQISNKPSKQSKQYKYWKKKMNEIIDAHTKLTKFKAYKSIW
jgi:hypothetical protein